MSSDALARGMHALSTARLHILQEARSSYRAASASLAIVDRESDCADIAASDSTPIKPSLCFRSDALSPCGSDFSQSSKESDVLADDGMTLFPSPLRVRRHVCFAQDVTNRPPTPPCTPPPRRRASLLESSPNSIASDNSTETWLYNRTRQRYRAQLTDFATMIENHISSVDNLIQATQEAQAARYTVKRSASSNADGKAEPIGLKERIERMKANTWNRERFDPEKKYQKLCAAALAEL